MRALSLVHYADQATDRVGRLLSWLNVGTMTMICLVVILRYVFHSGSLIYLQELVVYLHASAFMMGAFWCLKQDGHVRVDVFYRRFSAVGRAWVNCLGTLLFLMPFTGFLCFASLDFVSLSWSLRETSGDAGGVPYVYILKTVIPVMALSLFLQSLVELVRHSLVLIGTADKN